MMVAGQQLETKPPHFTVFNHLYCFAWVKSQVIPPKILNVILIHQVLGHPTVFSYLFWQVKLVRNFFVRHSAKMAKPLS